MTWVICGIIAVLLLVLIAFRVAAEENRVEVYAESLSRFQRDHEWAVKTMACEDFVLGDLSEQARCDYLAHVDECEECRRTLEAAQVFFGGIGRSE